MSDEDPAMEVKFWLQEMLEWKEEDTSNFANFDETLKPGLFIKLFFLHRWRRGQIS